MGFGVDFVIDYCSEDFVEVVVCFMGGKGVDVIVDIIVGDYVVCNFVVVVMNGCIVQIGVINGFVKVFDLFLMLMKWFMYIGLMLCLCIYVEKVQIICEFEEVVWLLIW